MSVRTALAVLAAVSVGTSGAAATASLKHVKGDAAYDKKIARGASEGNSCANAAVTRSQDDARYDARTCTLGFEGSHGAYQGPPRPQGTSTEPHDDDGGLGDNGVAMPGWIRGGCATGASGGDRRTAFTQQACVSHRDEAIVGRNLGHDHETAELSTEERAPAAAVSAAEGRARGAVVASCVASTRRSRRR